MKKNKDLYIQTIKTNLINICNRFPLTCYCGHKYTPFDIDKLITSRNAHKYENFKYDDKYCFLGKEHKNCYKKYKFDLTHKYCVKCNKAILKSSPYDLCIDLSSTMVSLGKNIDKSDAIKEVLEALNKGRAYEKFLELVKAQGGDIHKLKVSDNLKYIKAPKSGIISKINALELGKLSVSLGAGRISKEDKIDFEVGIRLNKLVGENVKKGDVLATIYYHKDFKMPKLETIFDIS